MKRRTLLQHGLGGMAAAALPAVLAGPVRAQASADVTPVGERLSLINAGDSNVLAFAGDEGLVLVDSGAPGHERALLDTLGGLSDTGVRTLFNTHWHRTQCGANVPLGEAGARIIAHQKTRLRLATQYYLPHEERYSRPLPAAGRPTQTFYSRGNLEAGGERIDYGYLLEAHTDGDIYVHFREANVLAAGDVLSPSRDPELDWYGGGWLGGRVDALDLLLAITDDDTRFVPAHGPVMSRAEVEAERDMLATVYDRLVDLIREGCGADCMLAEGALDGLERRWEDPHRFLYAAYKGLWAHHSRLADNIV